MPVLEPYRFEKKNVYLRSSNASLQAAKDFLDSDGPLGKVALMLEAAIQQKDLGEGGYEAWILLGEVRGMNEREELGMCALREGVRIATAKGGAGGVGMLWLAIAYRNQGFDKASQLVLLEWLKRRYPDQTTSITAPSISKRSSEIHELVRDAFFAVVHSQKSIEEQDTELQIGLGVVLYINGEFPKAAHCFSLALSTRPDDPVLWNRYGGCLSNGEKHEESLAAFREALRLRPQYTRAIYNIGVACSNIGAMKEAAQHFLKGLAQQDEDVVGSEGGTNRSEQLWSALRRALISMDRRDLADEARDGNLQIFRTSGFEF